MIFNFVVANLQCSAGHIFVIFELTDDKIARVYFCCTCDYFQRESIIEVFAIGLPVGCLENLFKKSKYL